MRVCTQLTYAQSAEALILNSVQGRQFDLLPTISTFVTVCISLMRRKQVCFRDLDIARAQAKRSDLLAEDERKNRLIEFLLGSNPQKAADLQCASTLTELQNM
jgi:hypothetical protein